MLLSHGNAMDLVDFKKGGQNTCDVTRYTCYNHFKMTPSILFLKTKSNYLSYFV